MIEVFCKCGRQGGAIPVIAESWRPRGRSTTAIHARKDEFLTPLRGRSFDDFNEATWVR